MGIFATQAWALSLGRISVQSSLGETLRAEIEIPTITAEEAASLKANVASPAAFTAAGLEYSPAMSGLQANLARRPDGRFYLRLTTDKAINDPYIDMILEANWASGRIVRDFTMLFDPPRFKQATPPAPTLPATSGASAATAEPRASAMPSASAESAPRASKPAARAATDAMDASSGASSQQVVVKPGDSASKIALKNKASEVSLDQMLVAMLRANPAAFSGGNLNRLRAGSVLDIPSSEQAKAIPSAQATQTVIAQSKDFGAFRRNLAGNVPQTQVAPADRKATGAVGAKVEDTKAAASAADKLTLSKGALKAKADEEAKLAKERAASDAKARAQELAKNIEDLKKLSTDSGSAAAAKPSSAPAASAVEVALPQAAPASEPAAPASAPEKTASAPAKPAAAAPASTMAPEAEPGLVDALMEDPMLPLAGGGLLALVGGLLLYRRAKGKKQSDGVDSTFTESSLQPESFFGASGGQRVDTGQGNSAGSSSMGYTNSQLGSADEVDPVAEADVYLAYGRDMQAEEILKAALPTNPTRLAIHTKLLEIYAKRRDAANFLVGANEAFKLTGAEGPEWAHICEMGLSIDPDNALYQPGGASNSAFVSVASNASAMAAATQALSPAAPASADVDLDLDFSADDGAEAVRPDAGSVEPLPSLEPSADASNGLDFDISGPAALEPAPNAYEPAAILPEPEVSLGEIAFDMPAEPAAVEPVTDLASFDLTAPAAIPPAEEPPAKANEGMLEFDLGSLSLDLDSGAAAEDAPDGDSSLETKLALAEEFVSIGDNDGARALIEEVVAEASGDLRERAQRALSNLS